MSTGLLKYADMAKYTDHHSRLKEAFFVSLSKRFFSLPLPSIQTNSIHTYPNGTPVNNWGQALEMWVQLKLILQ